MKRAILFLFVFAAGAAFADTDITAADLRAHIRFLASDELGGRLAVSPEFQRASQYGADQFRKYGLKPMGTAGFFQPFEMTAGVKTGDKNILEFTKQGKKSRLKVGADFNPTNGAKADVVADGAVVCVGYGVQTPEQNDYKGIDAKGKVVLLFKENPGGSGGTIAARVAGAFTNGAAGVMIVSVEGSEDSIGMGGMRLRGSITGPVHQVKRAWVEKLFGRKLADILEDAKTGPFHPFEVEGLSARMTADVQPNKGQSRNVLGFLPGNDPKLKDEIIVIGGHLDHIGHGEVGAMDGSNLIHNGADDNASGSAGVMELAQYYAHAKKNKRSILFMLFGGEEEGLIGSTHFVNNPTVDLAKVTAMINMDMIGRLKDDKLTIEGVISSPLWPEWIDRYNTDGLTVAKKMAGAGPSDHTGFFNKGIPVVFFFTNDHPDYHRAGDDWEKINYDGEVKVLRFAVRMVDAIDAYPTKIPYESGRKKEEPKGTGPGRGGSKIRIGLVPDYAFEGPGVRLTGAGPGTPAEKAGLRDGDIILKWNETELTDLNSLMPMFTTAKPGTAITLTVKRGKEIIQITVVPEEAEGG